MDLLNIIKAYAITLLLAFSVEFAVEAYLAWALDHLNVERFRWLLRYVGLGISEGLAFFYALDIVALLMGNEPTIPGIAITGAIIGGGADAVHTIFRKYILKEPTE
jgi:ABC-type uncharacterized transport system permease subunit